MSTPVISDSPKSKTRALGGIFRRRLNLDVKLPLMVILLLSLAFIVSTFLSIGAARAALINSLKKELVTQAASKAEAIRANLVWTRSTAIDLGTVAESIDLDEEASKNVLIKMLSANEQVVGSTIAYEPYKFKPEIQYWAPYYNRTENNELSFTQLGTPENNYPAQDWYKLAKESNSIILSPPYFDIGGAKIWMVTWSVPFYDGSKELRGIATADIAFSQTQEIVNQIKVGQKGYAFLIDQNGTILGIGNQGGQYKTMEDKILISDASDDASTWNNMVNEMTQGNSGFAELNDPQGRSMLVAYEPIGMNTGWSLGLVFPQNEIIEEASTPQNTLILYSILTVVIFGALLYLLTRSITQPLRRLTRHASQLSVENLQLVEGRLTKPIEIHTGDELQDLAETFNEMSYDLAQAVGNLEQKVADRSRHLERRSLELETIAEVAREITIIHDLTTLLNVAANLIREQFKYYHVGIFLIDELGEFAVLRAASSVAAVQLLEQNHKLRVGREGLVGNVTRTGQAHIALDSGKDAFHLQNSLLPETRSEIALPLRSHGATIGALDIQANVEAAFSDQDTKVLQLLADQLAAAIENAQLVQKVEKTLAELNNAYSLQTQNAWQSSIKQYDNLGYEYDGIQVRPISQDLPKDLQKKLENGEPVILNGNESQKNAETRTSLLVPVQVLNRVIGVIGLEQEDPNHIWTDEEITIAQAAANRAGITLENARLLEESQRRALKERTIFAATERIGSALNVEKILYNTVEEIERILGSSEVILQFNNDNGSSTKEE
jgi:GAF domain-containing protein/HAMP domain-containing protein